MKENVQALNKCATAKVAMLLNWLLLLQIRKGNKDEIQ